MNKQELRKIYLQKRMELSPDDYAIYKAQLLTHFQTVDLKGIKCISLFLPMLERREPDTFSLIEWLKNEHPGISLALPKTDFGATAMIHYKEDNDLEIDTNAYGIPEPVKGNIISNDEIDMVITPLLAFDTRGYRVGYGKGFYDRFTAECKPGTQMIGLSFFEAVDIIDDIDAFDIPMHQCITPQKIYTF